MTASAMQQMFRLKYDATVFVIALLPLQQYQHAASHYAALPLQTSTCVMCRLQLPFEGVAHKAVSLVAHM